METNLRQSIVDLSVYQGFHQLSLDVERKTRGFHHTFRWLRHELVKSAESVCAYLSDHESVEYSASFLKCLYQARHEARQAMALLNQAHGTGLIGGEIDSTLIAYEDGLRRLNSLIIEVEEKIEFITALKPLTPLPSEERMAVAVAG